MPKKEGDRYEDATHEFVVEKGKVKKHSVKGYAIDPADGDLPAQEMTQAETDAHGGGKQPK